MDEGYPCSYCGVNAWTSCKHREAIPKPQIANKAEYTMPPTHEHKIKKMSGGGQYRKTGKMSRKYWRIDRE